MSLGLLNRSMARFASHVTRHCIEKQLGKSGIFIKPQCSVTPLTRSIVVLSTPSRMNSNKQSKPSTLCSCGCGINGMHTKGDRELVEFLQDEITAEKKTQASAVPSHIDDFIVKQDKAELILAKKFNDEQISISLNVNHTVEADNVNESSNQAGGGQEDGGGLSSRPDFEVDIKIGSKTLSFTCQYSSPGDISEGDQAEDVFGISEITVYDGEWEETTYCASGDILDGMMYDLLMNYLEERGVSNEFAEKLSEVCTAYEHSLYVNMLEGIQSFVKRK